jgi:exo-beta-1,3-glucanase (GH17 family)
MKIYVAWIQENDWETEPQNIGCYSTKEKAEKAIVEALREMGVTILTLEIYDKMYDMQDRPYTYGIEEYNLDE